MKKRYWLLLALLTGVLVFYVFPNPVKHFDELYTGDTTIANSLKKFRQLPLKSIRVNEVEWKYLAAGKGEKTILFLHGMSGAYDIWFQQIEALKENYKIISVTYPAVGSLKEMGNAILQILAQEKVNRVYVVGSSLGGFFSQYLVATYPDKVEKAIYGNTFPPNNLIKTQNSSLLKIVPLLPEWLVLKTFRGNIEKNVVPASGNSALTRAFLLEQNYGLMSKQQFLSRARCVIDSFPVADTAVNHVQVMIIEADNDNVVPAPLIPLMKKVYPNAPVFTFHNTGHFPYLNQPAVYTELIRSFFSDTKILH